MKRLIVSLVLVLVATVCAAQVPPLPTITAKKLPKKKQVLQSPKAMSVQVNKRMASVLTPKITALAPATGVTANWVPVVIADTDGINVLATNQVLAFKFTSPNPTQGPYLISVSTNLNAWTVIRTGTGLDPLVVYDFTCLTQPQTFFSFRVDTVP